MIPVWLLDIDGVVNAISKKPNRSVWPAEDWSTGSAHCDGTDWPIMWSRPVVDFIRQVHNTGRAEVRWHTTWQEEAQALADLVLLPTFKVANAPEYLQHKMRTPASEAERIREGRPRPVWWKLPAAERVVRDEGRPLIWTDDDMTWDMARYDKDRGLRAYAPTLLVSPDKTTGLTRKHLRMIGDFLDIHAPIEVTP